MSSELIIDNSSQIIGIDRGILVFKINQEYLSEKVIQPGKSYLISVCDLYVTNLTSENLALRVRTTKRLSYKVDPTYSIVLPNQKKFIRIYFYTRLNEKIDAKGHKFKFEAFIIKDQIPTDKNVKDFFMEFINKKIPVKGSSICKNVIFIDDNNYSIPNDEDDNNLLLTSLAESQISQFSNTLNSNNNNLFSSALIDNNSIQNDSKLKRNVKQKYINNNGNNVNNINNTNNSDNTNNNDYNNYYKYNYNGKRYYYSGYYSGYDTNSDPELDKNKNQNRTHSSYNPNFKTIPTNKQLSSSQNLNNNNKSRINNTNNNDNDYPKITRKTPHNLSPDHGIKKSLTERNNYKSTLNKNKIGDQFYDPVKSQRVKTTPSILQKSFLEIITDAVNEANEEEEENIEKNNNKLKSTSKDNKNNVKGFLNKIKNDKKLLFGTIGIFVLAVFLGFILSRKKQ